MTINDQDNLNQWNNLDKYIKQDILDGNWATVSGIARRFKCECGGKITLPIMKYVNYDASKFHCYSCQSKVTN